jgi:hypothetical protein
MIIPPISTIHAQTIDLESIQLVSSRAVDDSVETVAFVMEAVAFIMIAVEEDNVIPLLVDWDGWHWHPGDLNKIATSADIQTLVRTFMICYKVNRMKIKK